MATARVADGAPRCRKRYELERALWKQGHRFPTGDHAQIGQPLSGFDCVVNIWGWLDAREDPQGRLYGVTAEELEREACWHGKPGVLWQALLDTEWIEHDGAGLRWHDYYALNGRVIADRLKKRARRAKAEPAPDGPRAGGTRGGTRGGTNRGDTTGDKKGDGTSPRSASGDTRGDARGDEQEGQEGGVTRARSGSGSGSDLKKLPLVSGSGVDPARDPRPTAVPGGSSSPPAPPEGAKPVLPRRRGREALLSAEPNLAEQPARDDGRARTLRTGRGYLGLIAARDPERYARLMETGLRNPAPGALLLEVDPSAFRVLEEDLERRWDGVTDHEAYVRSALADAWWGALGRLADAATAARARRRGGDAPSVAAG